MKKIFFFAAAAAIVSLTACNGGAVKPDLATDVDTISYELGMSNTQGVENYFLQMGIDSTHIDDFLRGMKDGALVGEDKAKQAYYLGLQAGLQTTMQMLPGMEARVFAGDTTTHLSTKNFLAGFADALKKRGAFKLDSALVNPQTASMDLNQRTAAYLERSLEKRFADEKKAALAWMQEKSKEEGVKELGQGVYYKELVAGTGAKPAETDRILMEYEGRLMNDSVFDSTIARQPGKPVEMGVNGMIEGMRLALTAMPVGSEWEIYIPYDKAYGAAPQGPMPAFSNLKFRVKLAGIKEKQ
ncbi:MAG: FKBP-type peptidyl-prolyl cis-trans isomerase [Alloprevotella sp.]|nr:FKBP-type peptidyl-prolyl cis-trans isomerase [Alloprevotella sp.]